MKTHVFPWLAAGLLALLVPCVRAQEGGGEPAGGEEAEKKPDDDESKAKYFAVVNADIFTGTGSVLRGATLLARNGKIQEIGYTVFVPEAAEVLDAHQMSVYPGLVAFSSNGLIGRSNDDFADTVDPFNENMVLALASGITSTGAGSSACKLKYGEIEGVLMRDKYLSTQSYSSGNPSGKRTLREKMEAAAKYVRDYREWEEKKKEDKELKEPSRKGIDAAVVSILKGEVLARFNADTREDLLDIARLAQKYGFRPVIQGCREGWTVADELGRAGAIAIVTPRQRAEKSEEVVRPSGSSIENAAILHRSGVQIGILPGTTGVILMGIAGRDILHLPIEADFAVRGGLSERAALEAMTIVPARALGIDHRVGTLEVGKDCDLIVTDGDVLHYETFVQYAVIEGKIRYDKQKELFFAHIRPRAETHLAPEERVDAGEEPEKKPEEPPKDGEGKNGGG